MGSGGSTEATGKQPGGGASTDPKRQQGGEKVRTVRSDSPVNNNTPRNAKTKFIIKKDPVSSDVTNDLDVYGSSWNQPENNNQEKTNNDYNSKKHGTLPPRLPTPPEDLPETYAQRQFREQYRQTELLRQKTIYRDPDEWDVPEKRESVGSFDVSKFKAANANTQVQKREIFSMTPDYTKHNRQTDIADDLYQSPSLQKQKSIPKYDVSEEELMADIEKQFM
ncbi:uncharacterized protein LOC111115576 isoform X2 [Crassostrea virginica]